MEFSHYEPVPPKVQNELVARHSARRVEDTDRTVGGAKAPTLSPCQATEVGAFALLQVYRL